MIRKARKVTGARFVEISEVDKAACDLATINAVRLAKRADEPTEIFDFNPEAIKAIGATEEEAGMLRKMFGWLFRKKETKSEIEVKPETITDLRKQFLDELAKGAAGMAITEEQATELIALLKSEKGDKVEKKGARFSAETKGVFAGVRKSMETAGGYFGKAAAAYPDDENMSNGMAHHMSACMKMDSALADSHITTDLDDKDPSDAVKPAKAEEVTNLVKAALAPLEKQLETLSGQLKELTTKNADLDKENAVLKGKLEVIGNQPVKPKAIIGTGFMQVNKGDAALNLHRQATGADGEVIDVKKIDKNDPQAYQKALTAVYANPESMRSLKVPMDQNVA